MKKTILLSSILAVGAAFADATVNSTEIGVMGIAMPTKAALIAVPFLGYDTPNIKVADMVNTAQLGVGSKLYVPNADGKYDVWTLDANKQWLETSENVVIGADGTVGDGDTPNAADVLTSRGGAFWLEPASGSDAARIYLLGNPGSGSGMSNAVGGKWNLVGNASGSAVAALGAAAGMRDQVAIQIDGNLRYYMYMGQTNGWCYQNNDGSWAKNQELPVALGQGLWFKPAASATINWANGTITPVNAQ